jgi:hypothetical protein
MPRGARAPGDGAGLAPSRGTSDGRVSATAWPGSRDYEGLFLVTPET